MIRDNKRLWKLLGNEELNIKGRSKKSIESELKFYQGKFRSGKTKSVSNRIARLEEAMEKYGQ